MKNCINTLVFGMQMPGRKFNGGDYRYGYQGSEMDNEVAGEGNSYTTHYRLLDPRIGRWRSLDPKMAKYPNKSPYISMSNNPVIKIDPNGDDDYYNAAGKYLGTWGDGTKIRVIKASASMAYIVAEKFSTYMEAGYEEHINKQTSFITFPTSEEVNTSFDNLFKESNEERIEIVMYFILDVNTGEVTIEKLEGDYQKENTLTSSVNPHKIQMTPYGERFIFHEDINKVIIGQGHGHPSQIDPKKHNRFSSGTLTKSTETILDTSTQDQNAANEMGVPVHAADDVGQVHRVVPSGDKSTEVSGGGQKILQESLKISGK